MNRFNPITAVVGVKNDILREKNAKKAPITLKCFKKLI